MSVDCRATPGLFESLKKLELPPLASIESGWRSSAYLPDPTRSFTEVFALHAARTPGRAALGVVGFKGKEPEAEMHTLADLEQSARRAARMLEQAGVDRGDRVILSLSAPEQFLAFLLGAQALGAIPVPLPSVAELQLAAYATRISSVARDSSPRAMVYDDARARESVHGALGHEIALIDAGGDALEHVLPLGDDRYVVERSLHDVAFMQYTSGSTGNPKGVVVLHYNAIANIRAMIEGGHVDHDDVMLSWLPLFHDMGLVAGLMLGLYLGIPTYVASPRSFVTRPDSWLRAVTRFRASFSPGPNFAYGILARRIPDSALSGLDLSSWRLAFDGAEPIDPETAHRFVERFAPHGFRADCFRPAYGMAECTLAASFTPPGQPTAFDHVDRRELANHGLAIPAARDSSAGVAFVGCGRAVPGHRIRILDADSARELPERTLGEIAVSGPSVTPGYFRDLAGGQPCRTELRTGDLGYVADGELFVVDRLKDLLIIAGRKYVPADVEREVALVDGVRPGGVIAFAERGNEGTDDLFLMVAGEPRALRDPDRLRAAVRSRVQQHFGVTPADVLVVKPGQLPKTSSGKLQRSACRDLHARPDEGSD